MNKTGHYGSGLYNYKMFFGICKGSQERHNVQVFLLDKTGIEDV